MANDIESIRSRLAAIVKPEAIDDWLETYNEAFDAKPIDLIGTDRQSEIESMLFQLETGMPG